MPIRLQPPVDIPHTLLHPVLVASTREPTQENLEKEFLQSEESRGWGGGNFDVVEHIIWCHRRSSAEKCSSNYFLKVIYYINGIKIHYALKVFCLVEHCMENIADTGKLALCLCAARGGAPAFFLFLLCGSDCVMAEFGNEWD